MTGETPHVTWAQGGSAFVVSLDGDRITVRSTIPSAPGSRPEGRIATGVLGGSSTSLRVWMKVARCRREGDAFVIDGRLLDTTRDVRAVIASLVTPRTTTDS